MHLADEGWTSIVIDFQLAGIRFESKCLTAQDAPGAENLGKKKAAPWFYFDCGDGIQIRAREKHHRFGKQFQTGAGANPHRLSQ
jgi:hypothetical protein